MLSTISPIFHAEPLLGKGGVIGYGNTFPSSQGGFTPWENFESFFVEPVHEHDFDKHESKPNIKLNHVSSGLLDSSFGEPNHKPLDFDQASGDHESPNQTSTLTSSGSDDPNENFGRSNSSSSLDTSIDERKRKRKLSNRESARRSRMRKQRHIENLRIEANRLKLENQQGMNRLRVITQNTHLIRSDNDRLTTESTILQRRLMELSQIWHFQQLQRNNNDANPCIPMQFTRPNIEQTIFHNM